MSDLDEFKKMIEFQKIPFVIDEFNQPVLEKLFELKPTLLIGEYGCGKTFLLKTVFKYFRECRKYGVKMVNVRDICYDYQRGGAELVQQYFRYGEPGSYGYHPICLDDIGTEPPLINYFGTQDDVISNILYLRYEGKGQTYASTNLTPKMLEKRYGSRLYDRFKEMFEVVVMDGKSRRK